MSSRFYPGQVFLHFEIIQKLGQGGTCEVYKSLDQESNQIVALKALLNNQNALRFKREFRSMSRLQHPNIAKVFDYGESEGCSFFTMEFIEGGDLKTKLRNSSPGENEKIIPTEDIEFREIAQLFIQICEPLQHIHNLKIIHRDLKPANIMLTKDSVVKLMDFGLVKEMDIIQESLTKTGMFVGTVAYMSPEQGLGKNLDSRSDLYSLGVILFEALTGRLPFLGNSILEVFMKHIQEQPTYPACLNPTVPKSLEHLCLRLLEKNPSERLSSATEVISRLNDFLKPQIADLFDTITIQAAVDTRQINKEVLAKPGLLVAEVIGRESQIQIITSELEAVIDGHLRFIIIEGETGIGKSILAHEAGTIGRLQGLALYKTVCTEMERFPFSALIRPLEQIADRLLSKEPDYQKSMIANKGPVLASLCPRFLEIEAISRLPKPPQLEPYQEKLRAFDAIRTLLENISRERPLLLVLDDLHLSDDLSLEFLSYLIKSLLLEDEKNLFPMMIVATFRTEDVSSTHPLRSLQLSLSGSHLFRSIELKPLAKDDTRLLIEAMLGTVITDNELLDQVYLESGGNPFFIEEILKELIDDDLLVKQSTGWLFNADVTREMVVAAEFPTATSLVMPIPHRIREIIFRRLEKLNENVRDLLSKAAVIGLRFDFSLLQSLTDLCEDDVLDYLTEVIRAEIIEEIPGSGGELFRFRHHMVRNVLYNNLPTRKRIRIHSKIADSVHARDKSKKTISYDIIAFHLDKSQRYSEAIEYYLKAANQIVKASMPHCAKNYTDRVIELLSKFDRENPSYNDLIIEAYKVRGMSSEATGNLDDALKDYHEIKRIGDEKLYDLARCLGTLHIGRVQMDRGNFPEAMNSFELSLSLLPETAEISLKILIINNIALVLMNQGDYKRALEIFLKIQKILVDSDKKHENQSSLAMCFSNMGTVHYYMGEYEKAFQLLNESISIYRQLNEQFRIIKVLNNMAGIYLSRGDTSMVLKCNLESLEIARKIGDVYSIAVIQGNLGLIHQERGEYTKAAQSFRESISVSRSLGDQIGVVVSMINLGTLHTEMGSGQIAIDTFQKALEHADAMGERWLKAYGFNQMGEYYITGQNWVQAQESFNLAMIEIQAIGLKPLEVQCKANIEYLKAIQGNPEVSLKSIQVLLTEAAAIHDSDAVLKCLHRQGSTAYLTSDYSLIKRSAVQGLKQALRRQHIAYQWRFFQMLGDVLRHEQKKKASYQCYSKAVDLLMKINKQIESGYRRQFFLQEEVRAVFLKIKDIAADLNQDQRMILYEKILNLENP